jgi:hypothetical protein
LVGKAPARAAHPSFAYVVLYDNVLWAAVPADIDSRGANMRDIVVDRIVPSLADAIEFTEFRAGKVSHNERV